MYIYVCTALSDEQGSVLAVHGIYRYRYRYIDIDIDIDIDR